ncbi:MULTISPECIES: Panacea domain-containing protein [Bacillus cereus group]|uniref:Panacea domain-containing protein n=1 Tax=Bacillus cereus group TaxID=86661 RepID=UPI000BF49285|nr:MULTISPECIES: type II toxin-antitoxin system antitoxin SocA domain-containing protein [Bacillus cereus group]PET62761.1 hypothetical protein CN522_19575 [Bacillus cereus]PEZ49843.1 hypothetical protein CN363_22975 [Bacillus cereus]PFH69322.1 hypothetical protein COI62_11805 [Bacillus cereus]PFQ11583.1 hypothetical protein COK04_20365 [Bacillus cereus]PGA39922.1 hypothetical protein COL88_29775 [Bacillus thuringiensis]
MNRVTVFDVAKFFLSRSIENTDFAITHLKLQKLVYYAQAWFVTIYPERKLFNEEVEAWIHGPVCRELYYEYRDHGYDEITPLPFLYNQGFEEYELEVLETVWEAYGHLDGKTLEALTHSEDPWLNVRKGYREDEYCTNVISTESMIEFYSKNN